MQAYDQRFQEVLDSAESLFARQGFHATSMRDIARAACMSVAGLYYYLPSKQAALSFVCERIFDRLEAGSAASAGLSHPRERLVAFVRGHLGYLLTNNLSYRVLLHDMQALDGESSHGARARRRRYFQSLVDLLAELEPRGQHRSRMAAGALFGMLNWVPTWYRQERDGDVEELALRLTELFFTGFYSDALVAQATA